MILKNSKKVAGFSSVFLDEIVSDAVDLYLTLVEVKNITLSFDAKAIPNFIGDKDLLFQSFAKVLDNAIKFTPKNGQITVMLKRSTNAIIFSVNNSGTGLSEANIVKFIERFYCEGNSCSSSGNGLGFALVSHCNPS